MATKSPVAGSSVVSPVRVSVERDPGDGRVAVHGGDRGVGDPTDLRVLLGALEHDGAGPELLASVHDRHRPGEPGEEGGLLHRGVATADHDDVLVAEEEAVAGRARGHAAADEPLLVGQVQVAGGGPGGEHDRAGAMHLAVDRHRLDVAGQVDAVHVDRPQVGTEAFGLLADLGHQLGTLDALREAGEVLHLGGGHQRAAVLVALEDQRVQLRAGQVDRGGVAGRSGADDDDVVHRAAAGR